MADKIESDCKSWLIEDTAISDEENAGQYGLGSGSTPVRSCVEDQEVSSNYDRSGNSLFHLNHSILMVYADAPLCGAA